MPPYQALIQLIAADQEQAMTLNIPSDYESVLNEAVNSGAFANQEEALRHALELLAKERKSSVRSTATIADDADEWAMRFRAWAANHPSVPVLVDDSRESIYEGRGL